MAQCKYKLHCRMHSEAVPIFDDKNQRVDVGVVYAPFRVYFCDGNPGRITDKSDFERHSTTDEERREHCYTFKLLEQLAQVKLERAKTQP